MGLVDLHGACKVGHAINSVTTSSVSQAVNLIGVNGALKRPSKWRLLCTQDTYLRQGGASVATVDTDCLLKANTYMDIIVENIAESYIAVMAATATAGTFRAWRVDSTE